MRYSRQILFEQLGKEKQKLIERSTIAIVGVGGLGTIASELLTRAGIKKLILIDKDIVDITNLQRQTLFTEKDINKPKAKIAEKKLKEINSNIQIESHTEELKKDNINLLKSDLILDCTDNFETRFLINEYASKNKIPWIFATVAGSVGMTFSILPNKTCLKCIFKKQSEIPKTCDTQGVINTITHALSAIQVTEAIKILTKQSPFKDLLHYDLWKNKLTKIKVKKQKDCPICNKNYKLLNQEKQQKTIIRKCSSKGAYEALPAKDTKIDFKNLKQNTEVIVDSPDILITKDIYEVTIFKNKRLLIKECPSEKQAEKQVKRIYQ